MQDDSLGRSNAAAAAVIVVAACPKERALRVLDLATGTTYFTFGDTAATALAPVAGARAAEGLGSAGDYLMSSQMNEQALVFHRWGKTQPLFKCRTPETMGPVLTTPDGLYVLAGGRSGKAYAWEVASGLLVQSWDAHFKSVTCMALTSDGGFLITGSEDTMVRVWAMANVLGAGNTTGEDAEAGKNSIIVSIGTFPLFMFLMLSCRRLDLFLSLDVWA
jgi:pre-rRNA-processing protein IPI3